MGIMLLLLKPFHMNPSLFHPDTNNSLTTHPTEYFPSEQRTIITVNLSHFLHFVDSNVHYSEK